MMRPIRYSDSDTEGIGGGQGGRGGGPSRPWIIFCDGCSATEDDGRGHTWVACDKCKAHSVPGWSHAGCIGRYCEEQCGPDFPTTVSPARPTEPGSESGPRTEREARLACRE